jgi:hypothetical protein
LREWQSQIEADVSVETQLLIELEDTEPGESRHVDFDIQLREHRDQMHPGFQFVGDNVDFQVKVRHMTATHQNKDHHLYQNVAYKHRVSGNSLSDREPIGNIHDLPLTTFLPTEDESSALLKDFEHLVGHIWARTIPGLDWLAAHLEPYIRHPYMRQTSQKTEKVRIKIEKMPWTITTIINAI